MPVLEPARRGNPPEPEVYFRIAHVAVDAPHSASVAAYREQTVEIVLGRQGAVKNGNFGRLTRRIPADRVVTAVPERTLRVRPLKPPRDPRTPPVVETLRKALAWRRELDSGAATTQADIARREGVTRARVTQVLALLRLTPEIRERILDMPESVNAPRIGERGLRPVAIIADPKEQKAAFEGMIAHHC